MRLKATRDSTTPGFMEYISKVKLGNVDTQSLRPWVKYSNWEMGVPQIEKLTGLTIVVCDRCGLPCFACNSTSVYIEAYQVCDFCRPAYGFCSICCTLILKEELNNPTHEHTLNPIQPKIILFGDKEEENQQVAPYDADIMQMKPKKFFRTPEEVRCGHWRFFGVELEVEKIKAGPDKLDERVTKAVDNTFFLLKHDGSLSKKGKGGFEMVTMPATLKYHQSGIWNYFFQYCAPFFEVAPPTASLHIHFGTDSVTEGVLGKMGQFVNDPQNTEFLANIAHRELGVANPNGKVYMRLYPNQKAAAIIKLKAHDPMCPWHPRNLHTNNRYALLKDKTVQTDEFGNPVIASLKGSDITVRRACRCKDGRYLVEDHYAAFNLHTKRPTAELRIFRGVMKKEFLFAALEFTESLIDFCTNTAPSELNYQVFLNWCETQRKSYPYLTKLLVIRGWLEPPKSRRNLELERNMTSAYSSDGK